MPRNLTLWALLLVVLAPAAAGQVLGRVEGRQSSSGSYYVNALPNEPHRPLRDVYVLRHYEG